MVQSVILLYKLTDAETSTRVLRTSFIGEKSKHVKFKVQVRSIFGGKAELPAFAAADGGAFEASTDDSGGEDILQLGGEDGDRDAKTERPKPSRCVSHEIDLCRKSLLI